MDLDEIVRRAPRATPKAWTVLETSGDPHLVVEIAPDASPEFAQMVEAGETAEVGEEVTWGWATDGERAVAVVSVGSDPAMELVLVVAPADDRQRTQLASLGREGQAGLAIHGSRETLVAALEVHDTDRDAAVTTQAVLVLPPATSDTLARIAFGGGGYGAGP